MKDIDDIKFILGKLIETRDMTYNEVLRPGYHFERAFATDSSCKM